MRRLAAVAVIATSVVASTWSEAAVPPVADPAAWSGVTELVTADIDASGAVSGTPSQQTLVTATGTSTVEIAVPMSSSGVERVDPGEPPDVVDGSARVHVRPGRHGVPDRRVRLRAAAPGDDHSHLRARRRADDAGRARELALRSEGRAQRADGLVRDRERDKPDHDSHLHGRRRWRANGGGHAARAACRPALAHVPAGRVGDRRAGRRTGARPDRCRSPVDARARTPALAGHPVDLLLDERARGRDPPRHGRAGRDRALGAGEHRRARRGRRRRDGGQVRGPGAARNRAGTAGSVARAGGCRPRGARAEPRGWVDAGQRGV